MSRHLFPPSFDLLTSPFEHECANCARPRRLASSWCVGCLDGNQLISLLHCFVFGPLRRLGRKLWPWWLTYWPRIDLAILVAFTGGVVGTLAADGFGVWWFDLVIVLIYVNWWRLVIKDWDKIIYPRRMEVSDGHRRGEAQGQSGAGGGPSATQGLGAGGSATGTREDARDGARLKVPDSAVPIIGWRNWELTYIEGGEPRLQSTTNPTIWPAGEPLKAECVPGPTAQMLRHMQSLHSMVFGDSEPPHGPVPKNGCVCGIYALEELIEGRRHADVVGTVKLWGDVIVGDKGWRAEFAYPERLWLSFPQPPPAPEKDEVLIALEGQRRVQQPGSPLEKKFIEIIEKTSVFYEDYREREMQKWSGYVARATVTADQLAEAYGIECRLVPWGRMHEVLESL